MRARSTVLLLILPLFCGCVARSKLVDARAARDAEARGRRAAEQSVAALTTERRALSTQLGDARAQAARRDAALTSIERDLARSNFELTNLAQERAEALQLVEQLREELARVGEHLREFSEEKNALGVALGAAEKKAEELARLERASGARALLVRDLALALHDPVATGEVELVLDAGTALLRVPATRLFKGDALDARAAPLLAAVARVARIHAAQRIELDARGPAAAVPTREAQLDRVVAKLVSQGVPPATIVTLRRGAGGSDGAGEPTIELRVLPRG